MRRTTIADSIRMPHLPALSISSDQSADSGEQQSMRPHTEAGFVRDDMTRDEGFIAGETMGSFMHVQERAESMSGSVLNGDNH